MSSFIQLGFDVQILMNRELSNYFKSLLGHIGVEIMHNLLESLL
jgi:hypothetical protein